MIPSRTPFASAPLTDVPADLDQSTPNPFRLLQERIESSAELIFLVIARPFDPAAKRTIAAFPAPLSSRPLTAGPGLRITGAEVTVRVSDKGYVAEPAPMVFEDYEARVKGPLILEQRLFEGEEPAGQGSGGLGEIEVINSDGDLDAWTGYAWDGRDVEIRAGAEDFTIDQFGLVFKGASQDLVWNERLATIQLRDPREFFRQSAQQNTYLGTGGLEGPATLKGRPKPLCYGLVRNIAPVLIDAELLIYGVHDGEIHAVDAVRDNGVALTSEGDSSDILNASVTAGAYQTDLAQGVLRLGAAPAGVLTSDVRGDVTDSVYSDTTAGILRRIASRRLGVNSLMDPQDLETGSFAALDVLQPATVGLFIDRDQDAASAMNALMGAVGGFWRFSRAGLLAVGRLEAPLDPVFDLNPSNLAALERIEAPAPGWRRRVGYRRIWTVQGENDLAETVPADARELYGRALRFAERSDTSILARHRRARDVVTEAFFDLEAAADAEAARLLSLQGERRDLYSAPLVTQAFNLNLGDVVRLTWPRFGLDQGKSFVIVGIRADLLADSAELELWG